MSVGPPSARGVGFRRHQRARPERTASAARGHIRRLAPRISPSARTRGGKKKAPAKPVDATRYATADAGSIPAVSTCSYLFGQTGRSRAFADLLPRDVAGQRAVRPPFGLLASAEKLARLAQDLARGTGARRSSAPRLQLPCVE